MMLIAVRRLCGQSDTGPTAVAAQLVERINAPISPPPDKQSSGDRRVATWGVSSERSDPVLIRLTTENLPQTARSVQRRTHHARRVTRPYPGVHAAIASAAGSSAYARTSSTVR